MKVGSGQTATVGEDFTTQEQTYTLSANETVVNFPLPVAEDGSAESNETATLELFGLSGISLTGSSTATVTIINDNFAASGEDTSVNRPLNYIEYDNLGRLSLRSNTTAMLRRRRPPTAFRSDLTVRCCSAKQTASFDDQNRVYRSDTYSVSYSGSVGSYTLQSNAWYNKRGLVIKSAQPGGQVNKTEYDGAGRAVKSYVTDGGSDSGYSDAGNETGDVVYTQTEYDFGTGTLLLKATRRDRFHDATATGPLGDAGSNPKARVSYMGYYYDGANRLTDSVNVGTNTVSGTATAWTRPSSVPSRSDTVLVSSTGYNDAGWVATTTDPARS